VSYFSHFDNGVFEPGAGHSGAILLAEDNGCINQCSVGVSIYTETVYPPASVHKTQEGFIVFSGYGNAKVGMEEHALSPKTVFIVPADTMHTIKTESSTEPVVVFWFHASV